ARHPRVRRGFEPRAHPGEQRERAQGGFHGQGGFLPARSFRDGPLAGDGGHPVPAAAGQPRAAPQAPGAAAGHSRRVARFLDGRLAARYARDDGFEQPPGRRERDLLLGRPGAGRRDVALGAGGRRQAADLRGYARPALSGALGSGANRRPRVQARRNAPRRREHLRPGDAVGCAHAKSAGMERAQGAAHERDAAPGRRPPGAILRRRSRLMLRLPGWAGARLAGALLVAVLAAGAIAQEKDLDTPYVQTPQNVVDRMLEIAAVGPEDYVIDLGSGDGRMVITAARK